MIRPHTYLTEHESWSLLASTWLDIHGFLSNIHSLRVYFSKMMPPLQRYAINYEIKLLCYLLQLQNVGILFTKQLLGILTSDHLQSQLTTIYNGSKTYIKRVKYKPGYVLIPVDNTQVLVMPLLC